MTHILYLASGSARRFGENKLLHPFQGKPLFAHGLDMLCGLHRTRTDCTLTVVSRYADIRAYAASSGVRCVDAPHSDEGISHTIRAALSSVDALSPEDYLLFVVADQPYLTAATVASLLDAVVLHPLLAAVGYQGQRGNPTLFSASLAGELAALRGDTGGRQVLRAHSEACMDIPCADPRELYDIDTVEDMIRTACI